MRPSTPRPAVQSARAMFLARSVILLGGVAARLETGRKSRRYSDRWLVDDLQRPYASFGPTQTEGVGVGIHSRRHALLLGATFIMTKGACPRIRTGCALR